MWKYNTIKNQRSSRRKAGASSINRIKRDFIVKETIALNNALVIINFACKLVLKISFAQCANYRATLAKRKRLGPLVIITQLFNVLYVRSNCKYVLVAADAYGKFRLRASPRSWGRSSRRFLAESVILGHRVRVSHSRLTLRHKATPLLRKNELSRRDYPRISHPSGRTHGKGLR